MEPPDIIIHKGGAKRSFPFQGDETLEIMPIGGRKSSLFQCYPQKATYQEHHHFFLGSANSTPSMMHDVSSFLRNHVVSLIFHQKCACKLKALS
jgi:hypothetical protein